MKLKSKTWLVLLALLALIAACSPTTTPTATMSPAPTNTPISPTASPVPLYTKVTLMAIENDESGQNPDYTIHTQTPALTGSDDAHVSAFNEAAQLIVQQAVDEFKNNLITMQPLPDLGVSSTFDVRYDLLSPPGSVFSLKFSMEGYVEGAAHPYHVSKTLTFDLEAGKEVNLDELFLPNSDALQTIANYCTTELSGRDIGFDMFTQGAAPTPENYRNWNITPDGLLITFEQYQVAPGAAGTQTVTVPYSELSAVIDPQGPLAGFLP